MSTYFLLLEAVSCENLRILENFIKERNGEIDLDEADEDGITCLHIAAGLEDAAILQSLLSHGAAAVNSQTSEGLTPLHIAAMWGRSRQVSCLLHDGADSALVDANGCSAFMHAIDSEEDGSQACVDLILSYEEFLTKPVDCQVQVTPESEIDLDRLEGSPWITPRRGSRSRSSRKTKVDDSKTTAQLCLATKFEILDYEESNSMTEEDTENVETNEFCEELLTEMSSFLSGSGRGSSKDTNSPTFSYSTITCLESQKLDSLSNDECSNYKTLYGSGLLTECSTSDDEFVLEERRINDEARRDGSGDVKGNVPNDEVGLKDITGVTDEESYETADENVGVSLRERQKNSGDDNANAEEVMKQDSEDMKRGIIKKDVLGEHMKEMKENGERNKKNSVEDRYGSNFRSRRNDDEGNKNETRLKERNNGDKKGDKDKKREGLKQKEVDRSKRTEEQEKCFFNLDNDFNHLSVVDFTNHDKPTNTSGLPLNSTFCVESPKQTLPKQPSNFFIPFQNDQLQHPMPTTNPPTPKPSDVQRKNNDETIVYDWREFSIDARNETVACIPNSYKKMSCNELRKKIKEHGQVPGPITTQTRLLYVNKLWKLDQGIGTQNSKDQSPCSLYPVEVRLILTGKTDIPDCATLELDMMKEFCRSPRKVQWRGGTEKSSFNYLLLDPRVTLDLPQRSKKLTVTESFRSFILSVFYVGKGKRSRPYAHLHEAIKYAKSKSNKKLDHIWDIWGDGLGVISLHLFQSAIPVEAFTREACMVEALGLSQLTNQKRGEYYGMCSSLPIQKKRKLGIFFLYKAYQIFLQEGERQICKEDI